MNKSFDFYFLNIRSVSGKNSPNTVYVKKDKKSNDFAVISLRREDLELFLEKQTKFFFEINYSPRVICRCRRSSRK